MVFAKHFRKRYCAEERKFLQANIDSKNQRGLHFVYAVFIGRRNAAGHLMRGPLQILVLSYTVCGGALSCQVDAGCIQTQYQQEYPSSKCYQGHLGLGNSL